MSELPALNVEVSEPIAAARALVRGSVQGVGFRPFVYRLAREHGLAGRVCNTAAGVRIDAEGPPKSLAEFRENLAKRAPAGAVIDGIEWQQVAASGALSFIIDSCAEAGAIDVRAAVDRATCEDCRLELTDPRNRRHRYPFTNCTACGPRYSIVTAMPYERSSTTMQQFPLCAACAAEYRDQPDRRFHAEPNACGVCGPHLSLWNADGKTIAGPDQAIGASVELLRQGRIIALKGLGGFQLLTPADDNEAVCRLRQRKHRPSKPLAVMVRDLAAAESLGWLDDAERRLLGAAENPIVVVKQRDGGLAPALAPGIDTVGLLLPTTPLHHLLLSRLGRPVVATSGNRSEEPIVIDEYKAIEAFRGIADALLVHDRPIARRLDDSVVRIIKGEPVFLRLARGYAPLPLPALEELGRPLSLPPVLATGGHMKTAVAFWSGSQAILAQHSGDMNSPAARKAFAEIVKDVTDLYRFDPSLLACDRHPDYFTTRWTHAGHRPFIDVSHHHAHALAGMVEHRLLDQEVLAFTWDGSGYGTDGAIWGGEALRVGPNGFDRGASLLPFALPGGEIAIRRPNRIAFALLWQLLGEDLLAGADLLKRLGVCRAEAQGLATMLTRAINSPRTTSVGRLFDGVAALVLERRETTFEGEAAIALESIADPAITDCYPFPLNSSGMLVGDWRPMLRAILNDLQRGIVPSTMAARFHNALAVWSGAIADCNPSLPIVLSGGCFQNRLLTERLLEVLRGRGRQVYRHHRIPPGDGGLAAGQLAAAMMRTAHHRERTVANQ